MTHTDTVLVGLAVVKGGAAVVLLGVDPELFGGSTPVENKITRMRTKRINVITAPRMIFMRQFCHHILRRTFRDV